MQRELEFGDFYDNVAAFEVIRFLAANGATLEAVQRWNELRRHIVAHGDEPSRRVLLPAIEAQIESATTVSVSTAVTPEVDRTQPVSSDSDRVSAAPTSTGKPRIDAWLIHATLIAVTFAGAARLISHEWSGVFSLTGGVAGALAASWLILGVVARMRGWSLF